MIPAVTNNLETSPHYQHHHRDMSVPANGDFLYKFHVPLPSAITSLAGGGESSALPGGFQPGEYDVVCGRGKGSYNRPGNRRFRAIITTHVDEYMSAKSKFDKSCLLNRIIDEVRAQNNNTAKFIKRGKGGAWNEIGDELAREKVGHAMREAVSAREAARAKRDADTPCPGEFQKKQGDLLSQQKSLFESMLKNSSPQKRKS